MRIIQLPSCPACRAAARREFDLGAGHHAEMAGGRGLDVEVAELEQSGLPDGVGTVVVRVGRVR